MKEHIAHMIRNQAARYGSREVFRYQDKKNGLYKSYSWNELTRDADKVSRALISLGFGHESLIGIFSENRLEWTVTDIGILGIRGVVVPFFGTASQSQVKYIVDETGMQLMFVGNKEQLEKATWLLDHSGSLQKIIVFQDGADITDKRCITWENFLKLGEDPLFGVELEQLFEEAQPMDLATVIYTSGTTGEPKGVMLGHDNFMESFNIHDNRLDLTEEDVSLCFLPLSHIFERTWTYLLLHYGAVNVFLENPGEVINVLPLTNPTVMCTVPRFFEKTYEGIQVETAKWPKIKKRIFNWAIAVGHRCNEYRSLSVNLPAGLKFKHLIAEKVVLKKLRNVFGKNMRQMPCAGAAIREDLLRFFHATGLFINLGYGATETTASVSCFKNDRYEFDSIGTVMPGLAVKFSNEGEIMVKGPTIFRGYYKKPEKTAQVLKDGWYLTGDKGYFTKDGNLVMSDRIRDLFKTSVGKYVSPQKLELLLGQDRLIEQVIVVGDNRKYVSALIVPSFGHLEATARKLGLDPVDREKIASHAAIKQIYQVKINQLQTEVTPFERVVKFTLLTEPFSIENSAMTSTLKLRRKVIAEQYKEEIELMYLAG